MTWNVPQDSSVESGKSLYRGAAFLLLFLRDGSRESLGRAASLDELALRDLLRLPPKVGLRDAFLMGELVRLTLVARPLRLGEVEEGPLRLECLLDGREPLCVGVRLWERISFLGVGEALSVPNLLGRDVLRAVDLLRAGASRSLARPRPLAARLPSVVGESILRRGQWRMVGMWSSRKGSGSVAVGMFEGEAKVIEGGKSSAEQRVQKMTLETGGSVAKRCRGRSCRQRRTMHRRQGTTWSAVGSSRGTQAVG